jgi:uncharacterized membrane protein
MPPREPTVPRWAAPAATGLSLVGLLLSIYLSIEHFTAPGTLACPANQTVDCARVTTSAQATLLGIPVAVLGVLFFAAMTVACAPAAWRRREPWLRPGRVALAATGVAFVLYLVFAELFLLDAICLWCTVVHAVAFALFGVVALATAMMANPGRR